MVHVYVRTSTNWYVPVYAPSLNWLPCILPKHTWFSVHMCALFQSESCDIISTYVRTYVPAVDLAIEAVV